MIHATQFFALPCLVSSFSMLLSVWESNTCALLIAVSISQPSFLCARERAEDSSQNSISLCAIQLLTSAVTTVRDPSHTHKHTLYPCQVFCRNTPLKTEEKQDLYVSVRLTDGGDMFCTVWKEMAGRIEAVTNRSGMEKPWAVDGGEKRHWHWGENWAVKKHFSKHWHCCHIFYWNKGSFTLLLTNSFYTSSGK